MTTTQTKVESQIVESSAKALGTFCDDISQMFSVDMSCNQLEHATETVRDLKRRFEKLVAVISVKSEGLLEGTFHFIFDTKGLFTLPGVIIMLPEKRILDNGKYGSAEDAENMSDTMGEAGNLLAGSWDRAFREEFESHGHLAQFDTFVGNPRDIPIDKIGLANDEEVLFVLHEMTIGSYPPFNCGVIFPRKIFAGISESDIQTIVSAEREEEEKTEETEETAQEQQAATERDPALREPKAESEESDESRKSDSVESKSQESAAKKASAEGEPETQKAADDKESTAEVQPEATVSAEGKDQEKTEETAQDQQAAAEKTKSEESDESRKSDSVESESQESAAKKASAEGEPETQKAADDKESTAEVQPEATVSAEGKDQEKTEETAQDQQAAAEKTKSEESDESRKSDSVESESQESTAKEASAEGEPETQKAADDKESTAEVQPEATVSAEGKDQEKTEETAQDQQAAAEKTKSEESDESRKSDSVESESQESTAKEASAEGELEPQKADDEESIAEVQPEETVDAKSDAGRMDVPSNNVEQEEAVFANVTWQEQEERISESIKRMVNPPADLPGEFVPAACAIRAKDVMQKKVVWASGEDSVQQALTKMERGRSDYLIIGTAGVIEGIVSRSDLTGAMSPYLRRMFAKWRRPSDDATLQIKIKWIMSRPARTVNPETPLPVITERICRGGRYCLPVVDKDGNVQGTITTFDILSVLLRAILTLPSMDRAPKPATSHSH